MIYHDALSIIANANVMVELLRIETSFSVFVCFLCLFASSFNCPLPSFFFLLLSNALSSLPAFSIAECCSTPYSLLGLVFTVSFIALGVLTLCKFYLQGYRAFMNDNTMHRSVTAYGCVR